MKDVAVYPFEQNKSVLRELASLDFSPCDAETISDCCGRIANGALKELAQTICYFPCYSRAQKQLRLRALLGEVDDSQARTHSVEPGKDFTEQERAIQSLYFTRSANQPQNRAMSLPQNKNLFQIGI